MKVSQLLHVMGRNDHIIICDEDKPISKWRIFSGLVKFIHKDDPINRMHVQQILSDDHGSIVCLAKNQREKGKQKNGTQSNA